MSPNDQPPPPSPAIVQTVEASSSKYSPHSTECTLAPWRENPRYWSWKGRPILLLGASDDHSLFQWPARDLLPHLERMEEAGANLVRNTMSDRKDKEFKIYPYLELPDGRFDLNQWNPEYWERFDTFLRETAQRGIFIQLELWDRFDFTDSGEVKHWQQSPYNPKNNINYTFEESGFAESYPDHPGANKQPFFFTVPELNNNTVVLDWQQRFIKKVLDRTLSYDHVLYCMDNETGADPAWGRYWAEYIKNLAAKAGRRIYVTEMWDDWNLEGESHRHTIDHPETYDFVEISQNTHTRGDEQWERALHVRELLAGHPRPMNNIKIYGADGNKWNDTDQDAIERFLRHLLAGSATARFHRPTAGLGLSTKSANAIKAVRKLESIIPLWSVEPSNKLLVDRKPDASYLAAKPGEAYVLYLPKGDGVGLDLTACSDPPRGRWISVDSGEWGPEARISGGATPTITAPSVGNWILALTMEQSPGTQTTPQQ